jgi:small-conductance mechanosensitive channel
MAPATGNFGIGRSGRLAPLSEIAAYINENHHLPDMPSASEMQQEGSSVGELQAKLLAKVEELTLYMIEEHEANKRLAEQNKELQEQNRTIREQIAVLGWKTSR